MENHRLWENGFSKISCSIEPVVIVTFPQGFTVDSKGNKLTTNKVVKVRPKCLFFDVTFHQPSSINYITFRNHYTSTVSIRWISSDNETISGPDLLESWNVCLFDHPLMPNCHCEQGSQDDVILGPNDFCSTLQNVTRLRVILKQPSFHWKEYNIHNFTCYSSAKMT